MLHTYALQSKKKKKKNTYTHFHHIKVYTTIEHAEWVNSEEEGSMEKKWDSLHAPMSLFLRCVWKFLDLFSLMGSNVSKNSFEIANFTIVDIGNRVMLRKYVSIGNVAAYKFHLYDSLGRLLR